MKTLKAKDLHNGNHYQNIKVDEQIAVPLSIRLKARTAYLMYKYAEEMGTSAGKLLEGILDDVLPAFEEKDYRVKLRVPQAYAVLKDAGLLRAVNERDLEDRVLKRTDPGGDLGRPRKSRSVE